MLDEQRHGLLRHAELQTPAFVFDVATILEDTRQARKLVSDENSHLLFAMKSYSIVAGLKHLATVVDGFAASSLFEVKLARQILNHQQTVHITTPGLRADEIDEICMLGDYLTFNSMTQWNRYRELATKSLHCGLRVNPQLSFVEDVRYDPCRETSKLGIPLDELSVALQQSPEQFSGISGLHFHSNCDSHDLAPLSTIVERLLQVLDPLFDQIKWVNLGGGYLFNDALNTDAVQQARTALYARGVRQFFQEPGAALVRRAGHIVASVIDLFVSEGRQIAVLDTSVNHMPEVFEYQFEPDVIGDADDNPHEYLLAGSACLAGDLFGEYAFAEPLQIGSRVIFPDIGAYSMVKANMFNGINLPSIYALNEEGVLKSIKHFTFDDFVTLCGG